MRRLLLCLLACSASACAGAPSTGLVSPTPAASVAAAASASRAPATLVPSPSAVATAVAPRELWTSTDVALTTIPGKDGKIAVHLGPNFPLAATLNSAIVDNCTWLEVAWRTAGRAGTDWLPASAVTTTQPAAAATADFDALDEELAEYLASFGPTLGVAVLDVTRGTTYAYNATRSYYAASSMKVPIMLTLLSQIEDLGRQPTGYELSLLKWMIENSNNKSADELYEEIGAEKGIRAFMTSISVSGLSASPKENGWGYSRITPAAMAALMKRLHDGTILNASDRALALRYMSTIENGQRTGVGDSSPAGATIAMKDGWIDVHDAAGPYVVNSSGIVTVGCETYIVAIYTDRDPTYTAGFKIVRQVARMVGESLMPDWETLTSSCGLAG